MSGDVFFVSLGLALLEHNLIAVLGNLNMDHRHLTDGRLMDHLLKVILRKDIRVRAIRVGDIRLKDLPLRARRLMDHRQIMVFKIATVYKVEIVADAVTDRIAGGLGRKQNVLKFITGSNFDPVFYFWSLTLRS